MRDEARHTSVLVGIEPKPLKAKEVAVHTLHVVLLVNLRRWSCVEDNEWSLAGSATRRDRLDLEQPPLHASAQQSKAPRQRRCSSLDGLAALSWSWQADEAQLIGRERCGGGAVPRATLFFAAFHAAVDLAFRIFIRSACSVLAFSHAASSAW